MSRESVALAVDRNETEIDAFLTANCQCVDDVVFVILSGNDRRERTDKAVEQNVDVVVEDVDSFEDLFEVAGQSAAVIECIVNALLSFGCNDCLL